MAVVPAGLLTPRYNNAAHPLAGVATRACACGAAAQPALCRRAGSRTTFHLRARDAGTKTGTRLFGDIRRACPLVSYSRANAAQKSRAPELLGEGIIRHRKVLTKRAWGAPSVSNRRLLVYYADQHEVGSART